MKYKNLPSRVRALCAAIACTFLVGACGHDNGGQPDGLARAAQWARTYGGPSDDIASSVQPTADGGFIVVGQTNSYGAGGSDAWVLKLDAGGNVLWQKTYGGEGDDSAHSIQSTPDGGYVVAGTLNGNAWVLRLDARGSILWQKDYGSTVIGGASSVRLTPDSGYVVGGGAVLKLDATGNVLWQKAFGGPGGGIVADVQITADGGYVVVGGIGTAGWLARLDASGNIIWQKTSQATPGPYDRFTSVQPAPDGGYIVVGTHAFMTLTHFAFSDVWALKLDRGGNVVWQRKYGAGEASDVQPTPDGGYVVAGYERSYTSMEATLKLLVLKLDADGNIVWQKIYGSIGRNAALYVQPTADGGYIAAGSTTSSGAGAGDAWVLKLDSSGAIPGCAAMAESNAIGVDTSAPVADGPASASDTNFTPANSTAISADSNAAQAEQCRSE